MKLQGLLKYHYRTFAAIAFDGFCSSFCYQAKSKHPAYIFWWDLFYEEILKLPMRGVSVMIMQPSF